MTTLWKAEVTSSMVAHLSEEKKVQLFRDLSEAVDAIGAKAEVGREFKHDTN
jgi:uncharacterized tellurite resistance protein B-like protein